MMLRFYMTSAGIAPYIRGEASTFIPHSLFEQSFHPQSKGSTLQGLPLPFSKMSKKYLTSIFISAKIIKSLYKVP